MASPLKNNQVFPCSNKKQQLLHSLQDRPQNLHNQHGVIKARIGNILAGQEQSNDSGQFKWAAWRCSPSAFLKVTTDQ